jgi:chaperone modulatory protein CbpM
MGEIKMTTFVHISCGELCEAESIDKQFVLEAVEYGVLSPLEGTKISNWVFGVDDVFWFKKALRLQKDLELDWVSLALVVELLQNKYDLEQENLRLQKRLERFILKE